VGFEPTARLPVHGISSAAPSAARPPLLDRLEPSAIQPRRNWRRGEDLNPRGAFWTPIRFRVGRLQPGSATPPQQSGQLLISYPADHAGTALHVRSSSYVQVPRRSRRSGRPRRAAGRSSRRLPRGVPATGARTADPCSRFASRQALGLSVSLPRRRRDGKRPHRIKTLVTEAAP
jgi:hypothetical protein